MESTLLTAQYNYGLVALSLTIAVSAAYAALDLAARMTASEGRARVYWLTGGAMSMGIGIWSMHYIGMLALSLPVPVYYDIPTVLISAGLAILASAVVLFVVNRSEMNAWQWLAGGVVMGGGIAGMHYSGMAAMRLTAHGTYDPRLVALSLLIAVGVSLAALWIAFRLHNRTAQPVWKRVAAAVVMGFAIATVHYAGMASMSFHRSAAMVSLNNSAAVSIIEVAGLILVTFCILGAAVTSAFLDQHFSVQRQTLRAEEERWNLLMRQEGIFDGDLLTGKVFYSPRWLGIFGYLPGELPGVVDTWRDRLHPDDRERAQAELVNYLQRTVDHLSSEFRMLHRDGTWRNIVARAEAVWKDGRPIRLIGTITDVTIRKEAEAKLKATEIQFKAFMDHTPSLNYIKDGDGRMLYTNPTIDRLWNLEPQEWIGKTDSEIFVPEIAVKIRAADLVVLASDLPVELVELVPLGDGSLRQFLSTKFCFEDAAGQRLLGGVSLDITDRADSERRLRESESRYRDLFEDNPLPASRSERRCRGGLWLDARRIPSTHTA
jgi:PAS domain S-box-containing protein